MKKKNVLLMGYYGFSNSGDEAILSAICKQLKKQNVNIQILTADVEKTHSQHQVEVYNRKDIKEVKKAIDNCDIFIYGGGSIFQDVTSSRSIYYYLSLISYAKSRKKNVYIYSHGMGPINNGINRFFFKKIIKNVSEISVRDKNSYNMLVDLKVSPEKIKLIADSVFMLKPISEEKANQILKSEDIILKEGKKIIGISVREWKNNKNFVKDFAKIADKIINEYNYEILFLPFHYPKDKEFALQIIKEMTNKANVLNNEYTPEELMGIMSLMYINIGVRLHSLIFSVCVNIPMIGISYDVKIDSFLNSLSIENSIKYDKIEWISIKEKLEKINDNYSEITLNLRNKANENRKITINELNRIIKN